VGGAGFRSGLGPDWVDAVEKVADEPSELSHSSFEGLFSS